MGLSEDTVLVKLAIQGADPQEIDRVASQTGDQLKASMAAQYEKIRQAHADLTTAMKGEDYKRTESFIKEVKARVDAEEDSLKVMARVNDARTADFRRAMKEQADAAKEAAEASHIALEDFAHVMQGPVEAGKMLLETFNKINEFAEKIIKQTEVWNALKGSIDDAREATGGLVTDMDLMMAKNRAAQGDLNITDKQFGDIAKVATEYAHAIGVPVNEALQKLIVALETGNQKFLKQAGLAYDAKKVMEEYALAHHGVVDALDAEEQKQAKVEAGMANVSKKAAEAADEGDTASERWTRGVNRISNAFSALAYNLGNIDFEEPGEKLARGLAKAKKAAEEFNAEMGRRGAKEGLEAYGGEIEEGGSETTPLLKGPDESPLFNSKAKAAAAKKAEARRKVLKAEADRLLAPAEAGARNRRVGDEMEGSEFYTSDAEMKKLLDIGGGNAGIGEESDTERQFKHMEKLAEEEVKRMKAIRGKAGGGILAGLMFGDDGPGELYNQMNDWQNSTSEAVGLVQHAVEQMGQAAGKAMYSLMAGEYKGGFAAMAKSAIDSLGAQATVRAIFETAEGLAALANPALAVTASNHFASAALFASIGAGSAIASRAIGAAGGGGASAGGGTTGVPTASSGGGYGGSHSYGQSSGGAGGSTPNITFNFQNALPGSEQEMGRTMAKSLDAYFKANGQKWNAA